MSFSFRPRCFAFSCAVISCGISACAPDPEVVTRTVTVHTPKACAVPASGFAQFYAFGDFQDSPALDDRHLREIGGALDRLPKATRQLVVDIAAENDRFLGFTLVSPSGDVDVLAWPDSRPCPLTGEISVGERVDHQLTITGSLALVSGGTEPGHVPRSHALDLKTGRLEPLASDADLRTQRTRASATGFANGVLVSGGARSDGSLLDTAERLTISFSGRAFDRITLGTPRADHASVLMAGGEVLLVGGTGPFGGVIDSLEVVDAASGTARTAGLATLAAARKNPRVLRLVSGEILVVGGIAADNNPVRTMEWLSRDATRSVRAPIDIDVGVDQGAVPLPAGGALIVTSQAPPRVGASVVIVTPDGGIEAGPSIATAVTRIALFEASNGAPILWTGDRFLRWNPWEGAFVPFPLPARGPGPTAAFASGDPGLLLWTEGKHLTGIRIDVRGPFSTEVAPLLRNSPGAFVPDRLVSQSAVSAIRFNLDTGLTLTPSGAVYLADATYANFDLSLELHSGVPPLVLLRTRSGDVTELGGALCPFPQKNKLTLRRRGSRVDVVTDDDSLSCSVPGLATERVSLGLRGSSAGPVVVREVAIERRP